MKIPRELLMLTLRLEVADYCSIDCCGMKGAIAPETVQQIIKF
ncbi:MAG TPA: hypothetical protein V6D20_11720 [Candidatus Obscuribacterales bacterium]